MKPLPLIELYLASCANFMGFTNQLKSGSADTSSPRQTNIYKHATRLKAAAKIFGVRFKRYDVQAEVGDKRELFVAACKAIREDLGLDIGIIIMCGAEDNPYDHPDAATALFRKYWELVNDVEATDVSGPIFEAWQQNVDLPPLQGNAKETIDRQIATALANSVEGFVFHKEFGGMINLEYLSGRKMKADGNWNLEKPGLEFGTYSTAEAALPVVIEANKKAKRIIFGLLVDTAHTLYRCVTDEQVAAAIKFVVENAQHIGLLHLSLRGSRARFFSANAYEQKIHMHMACALLEAGYKGAISSEVFDPETDVLASLRLPTDTNSSYEEDPTTPLIEWFTALQVAICMHGGIHAKG